MARFILSPEAAEDLREIVDFIAQENPSAARRFLGKLRNEMERIAASPGIGHLREDLTARQVRFWPVGRYLIVYRSEDGPPEIARVLHGARDVAAVLGTE
ncbi:MAG: type II toxin-antitoxin system RelE/ParE family toxin [bacterium]